MNGSPVVIGNLTAAPPVLGGVAVSVTATPVPPPAGGLRGTVTLTGVVKKLEIGGQEFWIDDLCAQE